MPLAKVPVAEAINMSAVPSVRVGFESDMEIVADMDDGLVEVGAVSQETRGQIFGTAADTSAADYKVTG
jgi:hypothetical protein